MFGRKLLACLLILCSLCLFGSAYAAEAVQDGLHVQLTSNQTSFNAEDDITVTLKVTNSNPFAVRNVKLNNLCPAGYAVASGTKASSSIASLAAGETVTLTTRYVVGQAGLPETGDNSHIMLWSMLLFVSVAALLGLMIRSKQAQRMTALLLCVVLAASMMPMQFASAATSNDTITVKHDVMVGRTPVTLSATVAYTFTETVYTRGQWVKMLAEKVGMNLSADPDNINAYYADSMSSQYGIAIETAHAYGILPQPELEDMEQDVPFFYPDELATREFAAYTAVRALGFTGMHNYDISTWADLSEIREQAEAAIAVGQHLLHLDENNRFRPRALLSRADANSIFKGIDDLNASLVVTETYDRSEYVDSILRDSLAGLTSYTVTLLADGTYRVILPRNAETQAIKKDDVIVLPPTDKYLSEWALKVRSVQQRSSEIELICAVPEVHEVFSRIDFASLAVPAPELATAAEGVELTYIPPLDIETRGTNDWGGSLSTGQFEFKFPKDGITVGGNDKLKASGSVTVALPEITAKATVETGWFQFDVKSFILSLKEEIKIGGTLEYTLTESGYTDSAGRKQTGRQELGRIPIKTSIPGISIDIIFFIEYEAKGTLSITYTLEATQGFQIVNGSFRNLCNFGDNLEFLSLRGEAAFYGGIAVDGVLCSVWDLVGGSFKVGPAFNASITPHVLATDTLICIDVTLYASMKAGLDQETVIGELLKNYKHYTLEWELLKNDGDNPFKMGLHVENAQRVDDCTFGAGKIKGKVKAHATNAALKDARVCVYKGTGSSKQLIRTEYTDASGNFDISNLTSGDYEVTVSATGYMTYSSNVNIYTAQDIYLEPMMMVDRAQSSNKTGKVSGKITDAVTGNAVSGTSYAVRKGWNELADTPVKEGSVSGSTYSLDLPVGNYTLAVSRDGYSTSYVNIAVSEGQTGKYDVVMPPIDNEGGHQIRIVLTWGETPRDLDSHLFGLRNGSTLLHTYYSSKSYSAEGKVVADLDLDDTTSYGPETTTIRVPEMCTSFSFYIHDYTNRSKSSSTAMSNSGAMVKLYNDSELIATFPIPSDRGGTVWHVFDYDVETGRPIPVNTFRYSSKPSTLDRTATTDHGVLSEQRAVQLIWEASMEDK